MSTKSTYSLHESELKTRLTLYGEAMAMSLLQYAQKDQEFAKKLRWIVAGLDTPGSDRAAEIVSGIEVLLPEDTDSALRRAEWLVQAIEENNIPGGETAAELLSSWTYKKTWESPQQIVVGVVQVAIPGITLGRIKRRKIMTVAVKEGLSPNGDLDLSRKISQACLGVLNRALRITGGNVHKIEPEIGDWFFGDMEVSFRSASVEQLANIEKGLTELGAIHYSIKKDGEPVIIAISPSVNSAFWNLKSLD